MVSYSDMIYMIEDNRLPFIEHKYKDFIIRKFNPDYPEHLFKWHWDEQDRTIIALNENDWKFQFDNELPINISTELPIKINKGKIHRIIKGTTPLDLKILFY